MIEYYIVEHNPNLFAVMSRVTKTNWSGAKRSFCCFVSSATTREGANAIIAKLEKM
jgi:hypothetical protein